MTILACALAYAGGAAFLGVVPIDGSSQARSPSIAQHHVRAQSRVRYGIVPATIVAITDDHCKSFSVAGPEAAQPVVVASNDPRFTPCIPTASSFAIEWSGTPTQAQQAALANIMGDLAKNHPTITLSAATPLIHAAVDNVR